MTVDQIKLLRDFNSKNDGTGKRLAGAISCIFNNEVFFSDCRDYMIYDDANSLLHIVRENTEDPVQQARFPFRITSGMYDNIQYMEALYDMSNFRKAVKGLLLDTGLINEDQYKHIMKWSEGVRNCVTIPKQPGPYFKDTVLPVGNPPVPEVRADGLHHAAPTNLITAKDTIDVIINHAIVEKLGVVSTIPNHYAINTIEEEINDVANKFKAVIESMGDKLYMASLTNNSTAAVYYPKNTDSVSKFVSNAIDVLTAGYGYNTITLYIEADNARSAFTFDMNVKKKLNLNAIKRDIDRVFDDYGSYVTLSDTDLIRSYLTFITNEILDTDEVTSIIYSVDGTDYTITHENKSIDELIAIMPKSNNDETVAADMKVMLSNGSSFVYDISVTYFNKDECACYVGNKFYNTLAEACAVGGEITLQHTVTESVEIPAGVEVVLNLNGHSLVDNGANTINNKGTLTIQGDGVIDNITHQKAVLYNSGTATILSGILIRSKETGVDGKNHGGNSFYVIQNHGNLTIGAENSDNAIKVEAMGAFSSLITNGWSDTKGMTGNELATLTIYGGEFVGGVNTVKNDELGKLDIYGGKFTNYAQHSLLNWHKCAIHDGTFIANNLPVVCNGTYGMGIGDLTIDGGEFEAGTADCLITYKGYPSEDIKVSGGIFSSDPSKYVIDGFGAFEIDGKYIVDVKAEEPDTTEVSKDETVIDESEETI